jgi:hypothetical protein
VELTDKLQLKPGWRGTVEGRPRGLTLPPLGSARGAGLDWILVFLRRAEDVAARALPASARLRDEGVFWCAHPKKASPLFVDLARDTGWEALVDAGWRPVRAVAIDADWSALRFRLRT